MRFQLTRSHSQRQSRRLARVAAGTIAGCLFLTVVSGTAQSAFLGPTPYLSSADSPFVSSSFSYFYLEDFEDGAFNTPGAASVSGFTVTSPGSATDSVDADDGAIDGSGTAGRSFISGGSSLTITFDAAALGGSLPTHAGIVWTDVGSVAGGTIGFGDVIFSALDELGNPLGSIGPFALGDGNVNGGTAEDRFFGLTNAGGISSITITTSNSQDWEVDHLQYGLAAAAPVPEPSSFVLLASGAGVFSLIRCRRKRCGQ